MVKLNVLFGGLGSLVSLEKNEYNGNSVGVGHHVHSAVDPDYVHVMADYDTASTRQ